ncbi:hypothetical protein B0J11DRAFT_506657 [Dendryphion nanum]|uniref:F-box domain-containing protein n=1 Tax=Dendryphion nanum TaxID=256645 RepID=A0A9P9DQS2_9PLEO|nr:hypothetical protein B0J11DRAFT_506657 [Dendryphion nanum]
MASTMGITDVAPSSTEVVSADNSKIFPFLLLPLELRVHVYSYTTISPLTSAGQSHLGLVYSCRQIQREMLDEYDPSKDVKQMRRLFYSCFKYMRARPSPSDLISETSGLVKNIKVRVFYFDIERSDTLRASHRLFEFYLDHIIIEFFRAPEGFDTKLKDLGNKLFGPNRKSREIHCKRITLRITCLANAAGEASRSTTLDINHENEPAFTLTTMRDENDRLVEMSYYSPNRFRDLGGVMVDTDTDTDTDSDD